MSFVPAIESVDESHDGPRQAPTGEIALPTLTELPATLTAEELRTCFRRRYDHLKALDIEYIFNAHSFEGDLDIVPYGQMHFAFSGEKRLKLQSGGGRSYPSTLPAQADGTHYFPYKYPHDAWCWNGEIQQDFHSGGSSSHVNASKNDWVDSDIYLSNAGIPIGTFDDQGAACQGSCYSRSWTLEVIDQSQDWEVLPRLEFINGAACHVLQSKSRYVKRLWIDPKIDFGVRFKDQCSRPLRSRLRIQNMPHTKWPVLHRTAIRDYRLVGGRVWLPWRLESVQYMNRHSIRSLGRPTNACVWEVQHLAINEEVPESRFKLQFPTGATVMDAVRKRIFKVGEDGTETMVNDLRE